jgi:V/A-type H+-transporting ATPase subunit D
MTIPIKYTKNELRNQQDRLTQLKRYLPTLQLKKSLLQAEINQARHRFEELVKKFHSLNQEVRDSADLMSHVHEINYQEFTTIELIDKEHENIAGIDVVRVKNVTFKPKAYNLYDTPPWLEKVLYTLQALKKTQIAKEIEAHSLALLEKEFREVSIRVNLFEKILIPRAQATIKKIKIFLSDQQLAAVARSKIAKKKLQDKASSYAN